MNFKPSNKNLLLVFFGLLIISQLINICVYILFQKHPIVHSFNRVDRPLINIFLSGIILAPVLEEFTFRAPLRINRLSLSLFTTGLTYTVLIFILSRDYVFFILLIAVSLGFFIYMLYKQLNFKKHYNYKNTNAILVISSLLFGILHLVNITLLSSSKVGVIVYVVSISLVGLMMAYLRLKFNLLVAIAFHSLNNLVPFIFLLFQKNIL